MPMNHFFNLNKKIQDKINQLRIWEKKRTTEYDQIWFYSMQRNDPTRDFQFPTIMSIIKKKRCNLG